MPASAPSGRAWATRSSTRASSAARAHIHRQLLALPRNRFQRAKPARRDCRHRLRRLADQLRGTRALLHQGRVGSRRLGPGRRKSRSIRRAAKPYPMPPLPVKSSGVLFERGARKLGPASVSVADGHQLAALPRPAGCVHCGFCIGFGCEVMAKSSSLYTMIPEAEATGRCEVRAASYVFRVDIDARGRATGVRYFDAGTARALPEGARRGAVGQWRRDAAAAAELGERPLPAGTRELERAGRQEPDVQPGRRRCTASSSTS